MFVLAIDVLLRFFKAKLCAPIVRTCADDLRMSLRKFEDLVLIYKFRNDFEETAGPHLKSAKSIVIPTVIKLR